MRWFLSQHPAINFITSLALSEMQKPSYSNQLVLEILRSRYFLCRAKQKRRRKQTTTWLRHRLPPFSGNLLSNQIHAAT